MKRFLILMLLCGSVTARAVEPDRIRDWVKPTHEVHPGGPLTWFYDTLKAEMPWLARLLFPHGGPK